MDTRKILIPGPAQIVLAEALALPRECTVADMVEEIERLKMAAAEDPQTTDVGRRKAGRRRQKADSETQESAE